MSQMLKRIKNTNTKSAAYGKYYVTPVYPEKFIGTKELADFIHPRGYHAEGYLLRDCS